MKQASTTRLPPSTSGALPLAGGALAWLAATLVALAAVATVVLVVLLTTGALATASPTPPEAVKALGARSAAERR